MSRWVELWRAAPASGHGTPRVSVTAILLLILSLSATAFAHSHKRVPPSSLFPTLGSLSAQNAEANRLRLPRILNDRELTELCNSRELAPIRTSPVLRAPNGKGAVLRQWALDELLNLSALHYDTFRKPLLVTSATRTVQFQKRLERRNPNAARAIGDQASVHTTGIAFDISWSKMTRAEKRWTEWRLWYLQQIGRVIVEEEQRQPCFHVVVLRQ